jgi:hypothetical protein
MALPFILKSTLRQKKNYGNSNISPCKNIILKKILYKKPKSFKGCSHAIRTHTAWVTIAYFTCFFMELDIKIEIKKKKLCNDMY